MKAKKLLLAAAVVGLLSPAIAASAMKANGSSVDNLRATVNQALARMGLPELPPQAVARADPGPTRLPFYKKPGHQPFAYGPLIWPAMADERGLMNAFGLDRSGPVGPVGGSHIADAEGGSSGSGDRGTGAVNGAVGRFGGAGAGGSAGFGGGGGSGGALEVPEFAAENPALGSPDQTPVTAAPVPASVWMMLAGIAGFFSLGFLRRRHNG